MDIVNHTFAVDRGDLSRTTVLTNTEALPAPREVVLRVDTFALTANNTTYADLGDRLGYWRYFPAEAPWGVIPAWGFADVIASACDSTVVRARSPRSTANVWQRMSMAGPRETQGPHRRARTAADVSRARRKRVNLP